MRSLAVLLVLLSLASSTCFARSSSRGYSSHSRSYSSHSRSYSSHSYRARSYHPHSYSYVPRSSHSYSPRTRSVTRYRSTVGVARDSHGRIMRSAAAKDSFKREHPCPANGHSSGSCPGYVIDHVRPLECGGVDASSNMQWQTIAAGKAKDKTERFCR